CGRCSRARSSSTKSWTLRGPRASAISGGRSRTCALDTTTSRSCCRTRWRRVSCRSWPACRCGLLDRRTGPRRWPTPMPSYYHDLLDVIGLPAGGEHPQLAVTEAEEAWVGEHLRSLGIDEGTKLLLLVVGANYG